MTKHLKLAFSKDNLLRSWIWLNSSSSADYKQHFRDSYKAYGLSVEENLKDLKHRLDNNIYEPAHSVKLYLPKKSGVLRPYSLLSVEDQIVYQALVSVIAEKFKPFEPKDKNEISFSNKYTNSSHTFFYKLWSKGYHKFNKRIIDSYAAGFDYSASFDLAAFYDTIDHKVLTYLLGKLKIEKEFAEQLCTCLETWSSTDSKNIYHGHGIPQGPLSSGLLSEVLLDNFDKLSDSPTFALVVKYARYVDDIRLMAKDEYRLRKSLVQLDCTSKNIGLFPQSSKIHIHKIDDIFEEIKTISLGPSDSLAIGVKGRMVLTQKELKANIDSLIKGGIVQNETSLKYHLGFAEPSSILNNKLLKLLLNNPHLFIPFLNYIAKTKKLASSTSDLLFLNLTTSDVYEEVTAKYIRIAMNKVHSKAKPGFDTFCKTLFKNIKNISSPELRSIVIAWQLNESLIKYNSLEKILKLEKPQVTQNLLEYIHPSVYGTPSYEKLINFVLCSKNTDTALSAAYACILNNLKVTAPAKDINYLAQIPLKALGKIGRKVARVSSIGDSMYLITDKSGYASAWRKFFKFTHSSAEQQLFVCRTYVQNDATAFVNSLDVFHDILIAALFANDTTLGTYVLGTHKIGSILNSPPVTFRTKFPELIKACKAVHQLRYKSRLSHAKIGKTGKSTTNITFSEIKRLKPLLYNAYMEVSLVV
jgi:Reverse transcriptase (RNA-dependent DNA polymerase)